MHIGNKGYGLLETDKDNILILQRIRIKDSLRIMKDKDKDKDLWVIWEVYAGSIQQNFVLFRHIVFFSPNL